MKGFRLWLIKKLLRPDDGYTFTGFSGGEPIKFYYKEDTHVFYIGKRSGNFYYCLLTPDGLYPCMSRHLPWGTGFYGKEPVEIDFDWWLYGASSQLRRFYKKEQAL